VTIEDVMHFGECEWRREGCIFFSFFFFLKSIKLFLLDGFFKNCSYKVLSGKEC
jgi:hypothetical protein